MEIEFWTYLNDLSQLKIYISEDGINYIEIGKKKLSVSVFGNRTITIYTTLETIPNDIDFIKLEISGGGANWKAQIGSVNLSWWGSERNINSLEYFQKEDPIIYPNPVTEKLYLKENTETVAFVIYNITGLKVLSGVVNNEINVSNLPSGVYFLQLNEKNVTRIVKQ